MKLISKFAIVLALISLCSAHLASAAIQLYEKDDWKFITRGFVELDMFMDSTRSLTEVPGSTPITVPGTNTGNGDNGRTQFSLRNSRFAFMIIPPEQNGWKTKGYMEFDFLGYNPAPASNSEASFLTNATLRVRHAYLSAESNGLTILAGQYWTLFGWEPVYVLATADVSPVTGSIYERTPQVTLIKELDLSGSKLQIGGSVARPVQRDSQVPNLDAGLRWSYTGRKSAFAFASGDIKAEPMSIGISGTLRQFVVQTPGGALSDKTHYPGSAVAINTSLPLITASDEKDPGHSLTLMAEATTGKGYSDQFPGFTGGIAQSTASATTTLSLDAGQGGTDSTGGFQLVHLRTWNAQLQYHFPTSWNTFTTWGYGELYSNNIGNITGTTNPYDRTTVYFANVFHDCTKQIRVAVEADHFTTRYLSGNTGINNRLQLSAWFRF